MVLVSEHSKARLGPKRSGLLQDLVGDTLRHGEHSRITKQQTSRVSSFCRSLAQAGLGYVRLTKRILLVEGGEPPVRVGIQEALTLVLGLGIVVTPLWRIDRGSASLASLSGACE